MFIVNFAETFICNNSRMAILEAAEVADYFMMSIHKHRDEQDRGVSASHFLNEEAVSKAKNLVKITKNKKLAKNVYYF